MGGGSPLVCCLRYFRLGRTVFLFTYFFFLFSCQLNLDINATGGGIFCLSQRWRPAFHAYIAITLQDPGGCYCQQPTSFFFFRLSRSLTRMFVQIFDFSLYICVCSVHFSLAFPSILVRSKQLHRDILQPSQVERSASKFERKNKNIKHSIYKKKKLRTNLSNEFNHLLSNKFTDVQQLLQRTYSRYSGWPDFVNTSLFIDAELPLEKRREPKEL